MREQGGLFTRDDLANWKVKIEEPLSTTYKGIEVYKLREWQQGPVMLQALNILETHGPQGAGLQHAEYIHTLYQAMNLAYADRDFYYGDPAFPPDEPMRGLLSKEYAKARAKRDQPRIATIPTSSRAIRIRSRAARIRSRTLLKAWPPKPKPVRVTGRPAPPAAAWEDGVLRGHDVDPGRRRVGLGDLGDAERRLDSGGHRRPHRASASASARSRS